MKKTSLFLLHTHTTLKRVTVIWYRQADRWCSWRLRAHGVSGQMCELGNIHMTMGKLRALNDKHSDRLLLPW